MIKLNRSFYVIVNPISGKGKGKFVAKEIAKAFNAKNIRHEIIFTTRVGEAIELTQNGIQENYDVIVAVGGDGTVNEIAGEVANSNKKLGIIPIGSGNGLARDLNIPINTKASIKNLLLGSEKIIDVGYCNNKFFACTAGVGFDAHMGERFKNLENRGIIGYIKTFLKEFFTYKSEDYILNIDNQEIKVNAFLITIANCKQWGNNFYISPKAKNNDGKLEICVIRKFPKILFPVLVYRLMCKNIHYSQFYDSFSCDSASILKENELIFHVDGEPQLEKNEIKFYLRKKGLSLIVKI